MATFPRGIGDRRLWAKNRELIDGGIGGPVSFGANGINGAAGLDRSNRVIGGAQGADGQYGTVNIVYGP
jgi:hypothetical protein